MTVGELIKELDRLYPRTLSCSWDNDGMMFCPDPSAEVKRVMLALDASSGAIAQAAGEKCDLLLTHHPLIFRPLKALTSENLTGSRILEAWKGGISIASFHTRLDAGKDGVNDALAKKLALTICDTFGDEECPEIGRIAELETPMEAVQFAEYVRDALGCKAVSLSGDTPVRRIALVGGDGKDFIRAALQTGADTFVTGTAGYNMALDAAEEGLNIIEAGHYHTEAPVLERLAELCRTFAGAECLFFDSNCTRTVC
jgi:dinuclear metal center YbgI/SA1388 family protein